MPSIFYVPHASDKMKSVLLISVSNQSHVTTSLHIHHAFSCGDEAILLAMKYMYFTLLGIFYYLTIFFLGKFILL
jgi:hypothetical protein